MAAVLRLGGLDGLNAAPLQWGLRAGVSAGIDLSLRPPAASAAALTAGAVDAALIPSIELARHPELRPVPGLCVAARRRVRSVILLTRDEPGRLTSVAVDETSRTSVALLTILLARRFGVRPRLVPAPADPRAMLSRCDGALLIADAALRASGEGLRVLDLAELWAEWTGLPFVFAVWAVRPGLDAEPIRRILLRSRDAGMAALPRIVAEHAARDGIPGGPALTAYLTELLHYTLGPGEEASLSRFFAEARAFGLVPEGTAPPGRCSAFPAARAVSGDQP